MAFGLAVARSGPGEAFILHNTLLCHGHIHKTHLVKEDDMARELKHESSWQCTSMGVKPHVVSKAQHSIIVYTCENH